MNANTINRALGALEKLADAGADVKSETGNSGSVTNASSRKAQSLRRKSIANAVLKVRPHWITRNVLEKCPLGGEKNAVDYHYVNNNF